MFCYYSWLAKECSQLCFTLKLEPNFILFNHHHTTCYIYAKPQKIKNKKSLQIFLGMIDKFCCNFYCNTNQLDQTHVSGLLEVNLLAAFRLTKLTILIHYLRCVVVQPMLRIWIKSSLVGKCKHVLQWLLSLWLKRTNGSPGFHSNWKNLHLLLI